LSFQSEKGATNRPAACRTQSRNFYAAKNGTVRVPF